MKVHGFYGGLEAYVWPAAIPPEDLAKLERELDGALCNEAAVSALGLNTKDPALALRVAELVYPHLAGATLSPPLRIVTLGSSELPIGWHYDAPHGARYKVVVYLTGGSMIAGEDEAELGGPPGTVVVFDVRLRHRGGPQEGPKRTLGLRVEHLRVEQG